MAILLERGEPSATPLSPLAKLEAISYSEPELQALLIGVDFAGLIPPRPAWMADAACRERPDIDFFPGRGGNARPALAVCRNCGVRDICLTFAQENGEFGVWGGQVLKRADRRGPRRRKADVKALGAHALSPDEGDT